MGTFYGCSAVECLHPKPNVHKSKPNRRRQICLATTTTKRKKKERKEK